MRATQRRRRVDRIRAKRIAKWMYRFNRCKTPAGRRNLLAEMSRSYIGRAVLFMKCYEVRRKVWELRSEAR
jgi:hypothetical protein